MSPVVSNLACSILGEARQAHVAVASARGPHVTPELFAWSGGRVWFASATETLKAKVMRREPAVGLVVSVPCRSVVLVGEVEVFDPLDPVGLLSSVCALPAAVRATAGYTVRNATDLLAFARDAATGRLGSRVPPVRVGFALAPRDLLVVENDVVVDASPGWASLLDADAPTDLPDEPDIHAGGEPAVLALPGPLALPARWFRDESQVAVAPALRPLVPAGAVPLSVVVDTYVAPGPAAKRGSLVRGTGRLGEDVPGLIRVHAEREVTWDGTDTSSSPA